MAKIENAQKAETISEKILKILEEMVLKKLKLRLTKVEYSEEGVLGKKAKLLEQELDSVPRGQDPDEGLMKRVTKLIREIEEEKQIFRSQRRAAGDKDETNKLIKSRGEEDPQQSQFYKQLDEPDVADGYVGYEGEKEKAKEYIEEKTVVPSLEEIRAEQDVAKKRKMIKQRAENKGKAEEETKKKIGLDFVEHGKSIQEEIQAEDAQFDERVEDLKEKAASFMSQPVYNLMQRMTRHQELVEDYVENGRVQLAQEQLERAKAELMEGMEMLDSRPFEKALLIQQFSETEDSLAGLVRDEIAQSIAEKKTGQKELETRAAQEAAIWKSAVDGDLTYDQAQQEVGSLDRGMSNAELRRHLSGMEKGPRRTQDYLSEAETRALQEQMYRAQEEGMHALEDDKTAAELARVNPDYYYQMAKADMVRRFGPKLTAEAYEDYVFWLAALIGKEDGSSFEGANRGRKMFLDEILGNAEAVNDFAELTEEKHAELKEIIESWMSMHDVHHGAMRATWEQVHQMLLRTDGMNTISNLMRVKSPELQIRVGEKSGTKGMEFGIANFLDLMTRKHWANKLLQHNPESRADARKQMILYEIARQTDGWVDKIDDNTGLVDFTDFHIREENGSYVVGWLKQGGSRGEMENTVTIEGFREGNNSYDVAELINRVDGFAAEAERFMHLSQMITMHDPGQNGHRNDRLVKYMWRYGEKFGLADDPRILRMTDSRLRDLRTRTFNKAMKPIFKQMETGNVKDKDIEDAIKYGMMSPEFFMMTPEQILENYDTLIKNRKITGPRGKRDRFYRLAEPEQKIAHEAMEKVFDNPHFDWAPLIAHYKGVKVEELGNVGIDSTKGHDGFKAFLRAHTFNKLWEPRGADYESLSPHERRMVDEGKALWRDELDKWADYHNRSAKGFGARLGLAHNPNIQNQLEFKDSGVVDSWDREGVSWLMRQLQDHSTDRHNGRLGTKRLVTDPNTLALKARQDENGNIVHNEAGEIIYDEVASPFIPIGRKYGEVHKPTWVTLQELEIKRNSQVLNYDDYVAARRKNVDQILGGAPRIIQEALFGRAFYLGIDPYGWYRLLPKNGPIRKYVEQNLARDKYWGVAPMWGKFKSILSSVNKTEFFVNTTGQSLKLFQETWEETKELM